MGEKSPQGDQGGGAPFATALGFVVGFFGRDRFFDGGFLLGKFFGLVFAVLLFVGCETVTVDNSAPQTKPEDREGVKNAIRAHLDDVRSCYEAALKFDPNEQGIVVLKLTIGEKGQVTDASTDPNKTTLKDPNLAMCLCNKAKTWPFPPPGAGTTQDVSYPFLFAKNAKSVQPAAQPAK